MSLKCRANLTYPVFNYNSSLVFGYWILVNSHS